MSLTELRRAHERRVGQRDQIKRQIDAAQKSLKAKNRELKVTERAQDIVKTVALETQAQLEYRISATVTAAQEAVFDDPYGLVVKFEDRRGKTECDILFERGGQTMDPLASSGYGAADIAAFALRVAAWSMSRGTRPVLILDEPFRHLKGEEQNRRAIHMVKELSRELDLQVIMVSDERAPREDIVEGADKVSQVTINKGVSYVKELKK